MAVLAYIEHIDGQFQKSSFEIISYAKEIALLTGTSLTVVSIGGVRDDSLQTLGKYGASKILRATGETLNAFDSAAYAAVIANAAAAEDVRILILPGSFSGKGIAPRLAVKLNAALIPDVTELPAIKETQLTVKRNAFSGKAFATVTTGADKIILTLSPNAYKLVPREEKAEILAFGAAEASAPGVRVKQVMRESGKVSLPGAEIVVSGGRGMKGPENWGMLEELAELLGAATACSKPVSDAGWRPHSEHVGQTGITIAPNLYIAIGISGAIQHLAGVSSSRVIAVINKDPEAPFFKAADYGIAGDAFEVIPKLIEALKERG
ncbi:electron transfer flavoprotein alpha subunit apoprotein [Anseongella ginsenosidimutans]|uniref:Electron transfer flavoprotein alpha subunit apoprotein n=1 Tax=Anseongella ginsenosidimutans TaxID=496056 RepID=A0A4R3KWC0_9SPHI|nr:electron transfer flavoprotein subunit alpha/FixB family protein [Anseongella ginsenosidimutans]QEC53346.1 electron transfer flavoprotein subunit alpha/FixB family protein [Anseongella ginsenosidimutans]TCS88231.1 electron transfer flavoprotein alpha subunit apoprotein [Anseongella ginsenosidimutans]